MRIDVKKFLFIGLADEREAFFKKAQDAGIIHFIDIGKTKVKGVPTDIANVTQAIKILRGLPTIEQEEIEEYSLADGLTYRILDLKDKIEKLYEEQRVLQLEMVRVGAFGDFSKDDIAYIEKEGNRKLQFFFSKKGISSEVTFPDEVIYIGSDHGLDYYVAINPHPMQYDKLVEMRIEHPLGDLRKRSHVVEKELHEMEHRLKTYARYNSFLHHSLIHKLNSYHLKEALEGTQELENLFAIEGWVPNNKMKQLKQLVEEMNVHIEEIAIEPSDAIPTYLENEGLSRIGQDVIGIYDVPSHTDRDPSLWVLLSFAFFFAFIIGDAGYGLIFLGVALYMRYKFTKLSSAKKRVLNLFFILCISCIAWGLLTNSFFGISFPPESPIRKVSLTHWLVEKKVDYLIKYRNAAFEEWVKKFPEVQEAQTSQQFLNRAIVKSKEGVVTYEAMNKFTDNILMEMAMLIGIVHVIISLLRYLNRNWGHLGWILFIIGGYLYFPYYLHATSIFNFVFDIPPENVARTGLELMIGGISFAVLVAIIKQKFLGLLEVMTSIQILSDILSYLRLYALALAGAIVGAVTNEVLGSVSLVFGVIIVILGHLVNIVLSAMSGVIHGLRLNFLEWYHYSFEGGGKKFIPLQKRQIE